MNTLSMAFSVSAFALLVGCSSPSAPSESEPKSDDSSESSEPSESSEDGAASKTSAPKTPKPPSVPRNTAAGTVGGASFTVTSGFAIGDADGLDVVLSDMPSLCESVTDSKIHAGETLIQLYSLSGSVPGVFTSPPDEDPDVKYATVKSTCASGDALQAEIGKSGRATSSTVTIAALTDTFVAGELDITFDDGSKIAGEFNVPRCASGLEKAATCF